MMEAGFEEGGLILLGSDFDSGAGWGQFDGGAGFAKHRTDCAARTSGSR